MGLTAGRVGGLLLGAAATLPAAAGDADPRWAELAHEARRAVSVIDSFYAEHHACPQPSVAAELKEMQAELGDGFSADPRGQFIEIRGISMVSGPWLYYTSPQHPDRCTLWHKLGWDPALIWRRHREAGRWVYDPGDGTPERRFTLSP